MSLYSKLVFILFLYIPLLSLAQNQGLELLNELESHTLPINSLAFTPDGRYFVSGAGVPQGNVKGEVFLWNANTYTSLKKYRVPLSLVLDVSASRDNRYVLSAGGKPYYRNIHMWDVRTKKFERTFVGHSGATTAQFGPNSSLLYTGGLDGVLKLWDIKTGEITKSWSKHEEPIIDITFSADGRFMASAAANYQSAKGEIELWRYQGGYIEHDKSLSSLAVNSVAFSPDGKILVSASKGGQVMLWDVETGERIHTLEVNENVTKVSFDPGGRLLVASTSKGRVKIWNTSTKQLLIDFQAHESEIRSLAFSPSGDKLLSAGLDKKIKIWQPLPNITRIQFYVEDKMKAWQKKDKFEKTNDYYARMQPEAQAEQIKIFTQEAINTFAQKGVSWRVMTNKYDADNETFQLKLQGLEPIYLKVPIQEAPAFDENMNELIFKNKTFSLTENDQFVLSYLEIENPANEKTYSYSRQDYFAFNPQNINILIAPTEVQKPVFSLPKPQVMNPPRNSYGSGNISEVDQALPQTNMDNPDAIAVVIGNSQYQKIKPVDYALNDARSMRQYLIRVLGFKPGNIIYLENATVTDFKLIFGVKGNPKGKLFNLVKADKSDVFIFYSGHGAPGLKDKRAYFVPVECDPQYVELTAYSADVFYDNLAQIPAKSIVVTLDACFSGTNIYNNISPIYIKSKGALGLKNGAVLASSRPDQISTWYQEKRHGMFTYFFLKALHQKNADKNQDNQLSLQEIYEYIADNTEGLPYYARSLYGMEQNPVLEGSQKDKILVKYK